MFQVDIVTLNLKNNGWSTILCIGNFPDEFFINLQKTSYPFALSNLDREDEYYEDVVRYYANTIVINLVEIEEYEDTLLKLRDSPYWHPYSNIIIYYHEKSQHILAKIYFSLFYHKAVNVVIVQYDDIKEVLLISYYSPFITDDYKLNNLYGCWTTRKIGIPVSKFHEGFTCENRCQNISSINSKLRAENLGTCIGFSTIVIPYNETKILPTLNVFDEKSKNFHGFKFRVLTSEIEPFLLITDHGNGSYTLGARDGIIWNSMAKLMNFSLDLTPSRNEMKLPFDFERNINQLFNFAFRKADFYLGPIYLFDVAVVEVDYTFPYKESGVCIISHRAGFVTTLFDANTLHTNVSIITQTIFCFLGVWAIFSIYQVAEKERFTYDQLGKDLINTFRNVLLVTLYNPPKRQSFRIFLTITFWSFYILNFANQASIISFLTAAKRGKEVETFEDMIETGYLIYGMSSPDLILPDTEERFRIINSRLVPVQSLFKCVRDLKVDHHRFCLIDCSVGHYLERNSLNEDGEQYLHIAQDRIHSHYLTILLMKHSPITERFNKYMITFYEAGLIKKWEQYRYADIKQDAPVKSLGMDDLKNLFYVFCVSVGFLFIIFLLELLTFYGKNLYKKIKEKYRYK